MSKIFYIAIMLFLVSCSYQKQTSHFDINGMYYISSNKPIEEFKFCKTVTKCAREYPQNISSSPSVGSYHISGIDFWYLMNKYNAIEFCVEARGFSKLCYSKEQLEQQKILSFTFSQESGITPTVIYSGT